MGDDRDGRVAGGLGKAAIGLRADQLELSPMRAYEPMLLPATASHNQKLALAQALLEVGDWEHASKLLARLAAMGVQPAAWAPLGLTLCGIVEQELAPVFGALAPRGIQAKGLLDAASSLLNLPGACCFIFAPVQRAPLSCVVFYSFEHCASMSVTATWHPPRHIPPLLHRALCCSSERPCCNAITDGHSLSACVADLPRRCGGGWQCCAHFIPAIPSQARPACVPSYTGGPTGARALPMQGHKATVQGEGSFGDLKQVPAVWAFLWCSLSWLELEQIFSCVVGVRKTHCWVLLALESQKDPASSATVVVQLCYCAWHAAQALLSHTCSLVVLGLWLA